MDKMKRCIICEGLLKDSEFAEDSPVCRLCVTRLYTEYDIEFSPPERKTPKEALVNLVLAIKSQAEKDEEIGYSTKYDKKLGGPLASWKHNWLESSPWKQLWALMKFVENATRESQDSLRHHTRRL